MLEIRKFCVIQISVTVDRSADLVANRIGIYRSENAFSSIGPSQLPNIFPQAAVIVTEYELFPAKENILGKKNDNYIVLLHIKNIETK